MILGKRPVTLTVEEAQLIATLLTDYGRYNWDHSRKTASAAIRAYAIQRAEQCRTLEAAIVRRLYTTGDEGNAS